MDVGGTQRERFVSVMLTVNVSKTWYLGIPLFFPVSTG